MDDFKVLIASSALGLRLPFNLLWMWIQSKYCQDYQFPWRFQLFNKEHRRHIPSCFFFFLIIVYLSHFFKQRWKNSWESKWTIQHIIFVVVLNVLCRWKRPTMFERYVQMTFQHAQCILIRSQSLEKKRMHSCLQAMNTWQISHAYSIMKLWYIQNTECIIVANLMLSNNVADPVYVQALF